MDIITLHNIDGGEINQGNFLNVSKVGEKIILDLTNKDDCEPVESKRIELTFFQALHLAEVLGQDFTSILFQD